METKQAFSPSRPVGYVVVPADVALAVRRFIARHSERAAQEHFGLSRVAVARAAAGLVVQGATLMALRDGMARARDLEAEDVQ
ncbi:MAG: hypothetical protein KF782_10450 [Labilithrix sp.]|nr:hypothetical protein [Labilithrix sp.]